MNKLVYDIGGSNVKFAVMSNDGTILSRKSSPTEKAGKDAYLNALCALAEDDLADCDGIAISTNGRMMQDGETYRAYTMDFLNGVNLKTEMERRLGLPVVVENDGLSATIGEWWKGAGQGLSNFMGVVLGTGMGGGLILNGKPYRGLRRNAAMVFGVLSAADPEKDSYTISGFHTTFALTMASIAAAKGISPREINGPDVFEWAKAGDPITNEMLETYYRGIAVSIFNSAVLLDLEGVILTGGLSSQPLVIEGVNRNLDRIAQKAFTYRGFEISKMGVNLDPADFDVRIIPGELFLDANLYGALYTYLHPSS